MIVQLLMLIFQRETQPSSENFFVDFAQNEICVRCAAEFGQSRTVVTSCLFVAERSEIYEAAQRGWYRSQTVRPDLLLVLEHGLSQLENEFVSIRDLILEARQPLVPWSREHAYLCAFIAAVQARTPAQRDHQQKEWGRVLDVANDTQEWAKTALPLLKSFLNDGLPM